MAKSLLIDTGMMTGITGIAESTKQRKIKSQTILANNPEVQRFELYTAVAYPNKLA